MHNFTLSRDFGAWHVAHEFYGQCKSVEAVFFPKRDNYYLGVGINLTYEGCYQLRISDMNGEEKRKYRLILIKSYCNNIILKSMCLDFEALGINPKGPIKLKLVFTNGVLEGYINDIFYIECEDTDKRVFHAEGYGGVWIHPGRAADVEDFNVTGVPKPAPEGYKKPAESDLYYELLFADLSEGTTPPCWSIEPYKPQWTLKNKNGELTFSSQYTTDESQIHLHVFENTPHITARFSVDKMGENGQAGFLLRHAPYTAYVRVGYSKAQKKWFIEDVPAFYDCKSQCFYSDDFPLEYGRVYGIDIKARDSSVVLKIDGVKILEADGLRQVEFGRLGLFANESLFNIHSYKVKTPYALPAVDGVVKYTAEPDVEGVSMGILKAPNGDLIGVRKMLSAKELIGNAEVTPEFEKIIQSKGILLSTDKGYSFNLIPDGGDYAEMCTRGKYVSMLKLRSGKYVQVHYYTDEFVISESEDLVKWEKIGVVCRHCPEGYSIIHAQSLAEYTMPDGTARLFLPIVHTPQISIESVGAVKHHNVAVYYSDDGGRNWEQSRNSTDDLILETGFLEVPDYAEAKVVKCSDNTLRLYCTRNQSRYLTYSESFDFGETWHGLYPIRHMQCAKSSFSVAEDPYERGTYYLAWVNDRSYSRCNVSGRTRFSLVRSYDGKNWEFLCDLERFAMRIADNYQGVYTPLFQVVDPVVTVLEDYILVDSGISARQSILECKPGSSKAVHHEQRTGIIRLEKAKLKANPWNEYTISDMSILEDDGKGWL
ncbi:MAG: exo-alpha-sialidase [Clostridia bacterium]|nr:exo-alpha-sialidase [Clostridia bacterium]